MLASIASLRFESTTHRGVLEPYFTVDAEPSCLSRKPRPLAPFFLEEFKSYLFQQPTTRCPEGGLPFHFFHADRGPSNIIKSEDGNVEGILDWEFADPYPRSWTVSKVMRSAGFHLESTRRTERIVWYGRLGKHVDKGRFPL